MVVHLECGLSSRSNCTPPMHVCFGEGREGREGGEGGESGSDEGEWRAKVENEH